MYGIWAYLSTFVKVLSLYLEARIRIQILIRIRIKVKGRIQIRIRILIKSERKDPDPDPRQSDKQDPDPQLCHQISFKERALRLLNQFFLCQFMNDIQILKNTDVSTEYSFL